MPEFPFILTCIYDVALRGITSSGITKVIALDIIENSSQVPVKHSKWRRCSIHYLL
jgi:hypothetical protein